MEETTGSVIERRLVLVVMATLVTVAGSSYSGGLAPGSLWVDDLWPSVLVAKASLAELFTIQAPTSPFFLLTIRLFRLLTPEGDLGFQLLPFLFALAAIPLLGSAVWKATGSGWAAVLAAALLSLNVTLATYASRVKSFTLEAAAIALLLLLACRVDSSATDAGKRTRSLFIAGALLAPLSFTSIFLSLPLVALAAWRWRSGRDLSGLIVYAVSVIATFLFLMAPRSSDALRLFWKDYYVPLEIGKLPAFTVKQLGAVVIGAFPPHCGVLAVLIPLGVVVLWRRRPLAAAGSLAMYGLLLVASMAERYPIGTGRTDLFTYPVAIFLAAAGVHFIARRATPPLGVAASILAIAFLLRSGVRYVDAHDRDVVELANRHVADGDTLLIYPYSTWAVAHYGKWAVSLRASAQTTNAFYAHPVRPDTLVLGEKPRGIDFRRDRSVLAEQLAPLLAARPERIWLVATSADPLPNRWITELLRTGGYRIGAAQGFKGAGFAMFERTAPDNALKYQ